MPEPGLTSEVKHENKFNIYISAITSMRIDRHNRIPTTDLRLIRRMVRITGTEALLHLKQLICGPVSERVKRKTYSRSRKKQTQCLTPR